MKNLLLLMITVLLVNVSVQASAEMGERDTLCPYINGNDGADQVFSTEQDSEDLGGSVISA